MFGFPSFNKLFVLVTLIMAVWYGFKWIGQLDRARKAASRQQSRETPGASAGTSRRVEDMVKCSVCGTYMPSRGAASCGKSTCPY